MTSLYDTYLMIVSIIDDDNSLRHALRELAHSMAKSRNGKVVMEKTLIVIRTPCGMLYENWLTLWQRAEMAELVLRETFIVIRTPCGMLYENWLTRWQRAEMAELVLREL